MCIITTLTSKAFSKCAFGVVTPVYVFEVMDQPPVNVDSMLELGQYESYTVRYIIEAFAPYPHGT